MITGISVGIIEISLFIYVSTLILNKYPNLKNINKISYYWLMMTILTGIWETAFVLKYNYVSKLSNNLLKNKEHVWTNNYNLTAIIPWNLSPIFYAEYAAYADREYLVKYNDWSRIVEGTHALFCGIFALVAIYEKINYRNKNHIIALSVAMGTQLMNSILYTSNYIIQTQDIFNINYDSIFFPCGFALLKRPFMYVNLAWTLFPLYVIISSFNYFS